MKIKRISTLKTYREYEKQLAELIPGYLGKSLCVDTERDILNQVRLGCNNPFFFSCVVLDDLGMAVGFCIAYVATGVSGKRLIIDHLYAPNMGMSVKLYDMLVTKLEVEDVMFVTYRNPKSWERMAKKCARPLKLCGYILKSGKEE